MDANAINQVVDKLADKIGVAADKLMPLGERALREVSGAGLATAIVGVLLLGVAALSAILCRRAFPKSITLPPDDSVPYIAASIVGALATVGCVVGGLLAIYHGLIMWLAPLYSLVAK